MREWNRYQLQVFQESLEDAAAILIQPIEVRANAVPLIRGTIPSMQVIGNLLLLIERVG